MSQMNYDTPLLRVVLRAFWTIANNSCLSSQDNIKTAGSMALMFRFYEDVSSSSSSSSTTVCKNFFKYQNTRRHNVNLWMSTEALSQIPKVCSPPMYLSIRKKERKKDDELSPKLLIFFFHKNWSSNDFPTPENGIILKGSRHRHALRERAFTSVVVVEITEVSGAGDGDHLSDAGRRPTRDGVPHALAACKPSRGETITRHHSSLRESRTHAAQRREQSGIQYKTVSSSLFNKKKTGFLKFKSK